MLVPDVAVKSKYLVTSLTLLSIVLATITLTIFCPAVNPGGISQ